MEYSYIIPAGDREDCLVGMSFYVPRDAEGFGGAEGEEEAAADAAKASGLRGGGAGRAGRELRCAAAARKRPSWGGPVLSGQDVIVAAAKKVVAAAEA